MKFITPLILIIALASCKSEGKDGAPADPSKLSKTIEKVTNLSIPNADFDKYSYTLGHTYITQAKKDSLFSLNPFYFILGALDAIDKSEDFASEEKISRWNMEFQQFMQERDQKMKDKKMDEFKKRGETFKNMNDEYIANFKKEHPNAKVTKNGIIYDILKQGVGSFPTEKDFVTFLANGYFMDGIMFDKSLNEGTPKQFMLKDFFPGMRELMQQLNPGARVIAIIPYQQTFGEEGAAPQFPPYSTMKMEIELVKLDNLPDAAGGGLQGLPPGVKIKDVRTKRIPAPPGSMMQQPPRR